MSALRWGLSPQVLYPFKRYIAQLFLRYSTMSKERPSYYTHPELLPREGDHGINLNQSNPFKSHMPKYSLQAIGLLDSVFKEKNGTPRQGTLAPHSRAKLRLELANNNRLSLEGLEEFGYIWLIFMFNANIQYKFHYKIKPPRLNGRKVGVFSTRSPHRPNPIGLSLAKLDRIEIDGGTGILHLSSVDLIDGTPILDIKPYLPFHDLPPERSKIPAWIEEPAVSEDFTVAFTHQALSEIERHVQSGKLQFYNQASDIRAVIEEVLMNEPRSLLWKKSLADRPDFRDYGFCVDVLNVQCRYFEDGSGVMVMNIEDWTDRYTEETIRRKEPY